MHALLITVGIGGDSLPFLALARTLQRRGHDVTFLGNSGYRQLVDRAGIEFGEVISAEENERRNRIREKSRLASLQSGVQNMRADIRPAFRAVRARVRPGRTVIVAHGLALGARLVHDELGTPLATVHVSPTAFLSADDPLSWPTWMSPFQRRIAMGLVNSGAEKNLGVWLNRYRADLGLRPLCRPVRQWLHSPQLVVGLFPDWVSSPRRDWPPETRLVGFPLPALEETDPLAPELEAFLAAGEPPVVVSHTSGITAASRFYKTAVEALALLKRRAVILAPDKVPLPAPLPAGMIRLAGAPHVRLYPRAALAMHHGGVGTAAAALAAGIPQFIVPAYHDHPEMARRMVRLGVADYAMPRHFQAAAVAPRLQRLLTSPEVRAQCARYRELSGGQRATDATADLLERFAAVHHISG